MGDRDGGVDAEQLLSGIELPRVHECETIVHGNAERGAEVLDDYRLGATVEYAHVITDDPHAVTDEDIEKLREVGLSATGIVRLTHLVSDFASYNRLNTALDTDYDYQQMWRQFSTIEAADN